MRRKIRQRVKWKDIPKVLKDHKGYEHANISPNKAKPWRICSFEIKNYDGRGELMKSDTT